MNNLPSVIIEMDSVSGHSSRMAFPSSNLSHHFAATRDAGKAVLFFQSYPRSLSVTNLSVDTTAVITERAMNSLSVDIEQPTGERILSHETDADNLIELTQLYDLNHSSYVRDVARLWRWATKPADTHFIGINGRIYRDVTRLEMEDIFTRQALNSRGDVMVVDFVENTMGSNSIEPIEFSNKSGVGYTINGVVIGYPDIKLVAKSVIDRLISQVTNRNTTFLLMK